MKHKIIFLSQNNAYKFIVSDPENYIKRFSNLDFKARNIKSREEYNSLFLNQVYIPNLEQIKLFKLAIKKIYLLLNELKSTEWVDINKFRNIQWKFIIHKSDLIDNGLPHTRYDTIVINDKIIDSTDTFVKILLHEQLHVYQKLYFVEFEEEYIKKNNFYRVSKYKVNKNDNYRTNPDTDEWIYGLNGEIYMSEYISKNPTTILDVIFRPINKPKYEHPREKAVYDLIEKLFKK